MEISRLSLAQFEGQAAVFCPSESALPALHLPHHWCPAPEQGMELKEGNGVGASHFWGTSHPKHSAAGKTGHRKTLGSKQGGECWHKHLQSCMGGGKEENFT